MEDRQDDAREPEVHVFPPTPAPPPTQEHRGYYIGFRGYRGYRGLGVIGV